MGPLSGAAVEKQQMDKLKALQKMANEEKLNKLKLAKELAKAKQEGLDIPGALQALNGAPLGSQAAGTGPAQASGPNGPRGTDTVDAKLTPGEAVIPAPVAQDPAYKGIIQDMVQRGRELNDKFQEWIGNGPPLMGGMTGQAQEAISGRQQQIDNAVESAVRGYADGTSKVKDKGEESWLARFFKDFSQYFLKLYCSAFMG